MSESPQPQMLAPRDEVLTAHNVAEAVYEAIRECAVTLRPDVLQAMREAQLASRAKNLRSRQTSVLDAIVENAEIGAHDRVPICQDTGTVWVCLEVGEDLCIPGNIFSEIDEAVARAYEDGKLRMSVVRDALFDRSNTNNNTPAFCELRICKGSSAKLHVLLKGGGSDNASITCMLSPDAGLAGVKRVVMERVKEKAANACPPLVIGVGVGATFDKVAGLSKHALLRPIGSPAASAQAAEFEAELLKSINSLGIGPGALGGAPTALAVHLETAPCHIAALPVAVNMGCCAMRSVTIDLMEQSKQKAR